MSDPAQAGPSRARLSHVPLVPASRDPSTPIASQYRFDAPHAAAGKRASLKSLLGLGPRRGSRKASLPQEEIAPGPAASRVLPAPKRPGSPKDEHRKAYVHHSPRAAQPLSPPLSHATAPSAARPRVSLPSTDRWCLSYDVAGLDPVPLDDADHVVFSSSYRPLKPPALDADPRLLAAPVPTSHWSDASSAESSEDEDEEDSLPVANRRREAGIYKAELIPVAPPKTGGLDGQSEGGRSSGRSSASSSRSSSPRSDRSHVRKDSITTQATSAVSSPQVVHADGTIFEMCESPRMEHVFTRAEY